MASDITLGLFADLLADKVSDFCYREAEAGGWYTNLEAYANKYIIDKEVEK